MKHLIYISLLLLSNTVNYAQQKDKHDTIEKINGDVMTGDVTEIEDSLIHFIYTGEKAVYKIKKSDIRKITFASGRMEQYNTANATPAANTTQASITASTPEDRHNNVAILPFSYLSDFENNGKEIGLRIQDECRTYLTKQPGIYNYLENRKVNVILARAGITKDNIYNYTMAELCLMLGAEFVIEGTVNVTKDAQTSTTTQSTNGKIKEADKSSDDKKFSGFSSKTSTIEQDYATLVTIKIYNDQGKSIFNDNRKPFLGTGKNAYKASMEFLLKKTPLYQK